MPPSKSLLKTSRLLHLYLGVFTTPALIFFAFTGFLQTFSFHETTKGSNYKPPQILVELGQLHKKQTLVVPAKKPQPPAPATTPNVLPGETEGRKANGAEGDGAAKHGHSEKQQNADASSPEKAAAAPAPRDPAGPPAKKKNLWPMKIFFAIVAVSLLLSTFTGLYMSYKYIRNTRLVTACLVAGIVIPVLLTFL